MKWGLLLGIGALCINFCAAADHKQPIRDKGKATWKDLQAGNFMQDPAPPLLTKESRNYARKVVGAYAGEENTFSRLHSILIHGENNQKKWNKAVDQWVHKFEDALHSANYHRRRKHSQT